MTDSTLWTDPSVIDFGDRDKLPVSADFATVLGEETITTVDTELIDEKSRVDASAYLFEEPSKVGTKVTQWIEKPKADRDYRLIWKVTTSAGKDYSAYTVIRVK